MPWASNFSEASSLSRSSSKLRISVNGRFSASAANRPTASEPLFINLFNLESSGGMIISYSCSSQPVCAVKRTFWAEREMSKDDPEVERGKGAIGKSGPEKAETWSV